jgi:hypothetical protein
LKAAGDFASGRSFLLRGEQLEGERTRARRESRLELRHANLRRPLLRTIGSRA